MAPLRTHANLDISSATVTAAVCQFTSVAIQVSTPVTAVPASTSLTGPTYTVSGSGTCTEIGRTDPFQISGSGQTIGPPTCAAFVSAAGNGLLTIGLNTYQIQLAIAGPTAGAPWVMLITPINLSSGGAGVAQLSLDVASLQACLQPGGTTTLNYSGTAVVVF